jgi:hypothetical protein
MSDEELMEFKKLYTMLIKKLHPDLNPSSDSEMLKLFHNTIDTYKNGDLPALHTIKLLVDGLSEPAEEYSSIEIMEKTRNAYKAEVEKTENTIAKIKLSFSYNVKILMNLNRIFLWVKTLFLPGAGKSS